MSSHDTAFAERLRSAVTRRGWTQRKTAEAAGLTVTALQNYLAGRYPQPTQAKNLAQALDIPLAWLLDGVGGENQQGLHVDANRSQAGPQLPEAEPLDWIGIEGVIGRKLEDIAYKFEATPEEVAIWRAGGEPRLNQMAKILDLVVTAAIGARAYAKMLSEIEAPTAHPDAVPAAGTSNQASKVA